MTLYDAISWTCADNWNVGFGFWVIEVEATKAHLNFGLGCICGDIVVDHEQAGSLIFIDQVNLCEKCLSDFSPDATLGATASGWSGPAV